MSRSYLRGPIWVPSWVPSTLHMPSVSHIGAAARSGSAAAWRCIAGRTSPSVTGLLGCHGEMGAFALSMRPSRVRLPLWADPHTLVGARRDFGPPNLCGIFVRVSAFGSAFSAKCGHQASCQASCAEAAMAKWVLSRLACGCRGFDSHCSPYPGQSAVTRPVARRVVLRLPWRNGCFRA
jgi:hypothetical protein